MLVLPLCGILWSMQNCYGTTLGLAFLVKIKRRLRECSDESAKLRLVVNRAEYADVSIRQKTLGSFDGSRVTHPGRADPGVGYLHYAIATAAQRDGDITQRSSVEAKAGRLVVLRTTDIAQLFLRCPLEPFDAKLVEVRDHREHSNMEVFQTSYRCDVVQVGDNTYTRWGNCLSRPK